MRRWCPAAANPDGFSGTSPVESFPPNGYGPYDMAGNIWQWLQRLVPGRCFTQLASKNVCSDNGGPSESWDPEDPDAPKRVVKGRIVSLQSILLRELPGPVLAGTRHPIPGSSHTGFFAA